MADSLAGDIKPKAYRPRIVDAQIERYMRIFGAVEITGTKWCGKTWSARAHAASITYVDRNNNLAAAKADSVYARSLLDIGIEPVRYYHDDSGLECDAIIELSDGRWGGIEIKSSEDKVPEAAANLCRLKGKLLRNPSARTRESEFLAVLVGVGEFAYQRDDGVYVIPVGVLGA